MTDMGCTGEIRAFPYGYAPEYWLECLGQTLQIGQYPALYSIIGTTYGGDGQRYFNLPNLQGYAPVGIGAAPDVEPVQYGQKMGSTQVVLSSTQMAHHTHAIRAVHLGYGAYKSDFKSTPDGTCYPGVFIDTSSGRDLTHPAYNPANPAPSPTDPVPMAPAILSPYIGQGQAHENRQPYLALRMCICVDGIYLPRP